MKLKPIISVLTLGCFASQTLILSGCVGQSNDSSTANKQISQTEKLKSSNNSYDKEIWANITKTDSFTVNSDLDILPTNNSDYDLRLVGCDNSDYVSNYLESEIPSKASPKITATYDPRWQRQDQGSGIYDPAHIGDNHLHYKAVPSGTDKYNCYYSVYVPEAGKNMYVKLRMTNQQIATASSADNTTPNTDQQLMKALRISTDVISGASNLGVLAVIVGKALNNRKMRKVYDGAIEKVMSNNFNAINLEMAVRDNPIDILGPGRDDKFLAKEFNKIFPGSKIRADDIGRIKKFEIQGSTFRFRSINYNNDQTVSLKYLQSYNDVKGAPPEVVSFVPGDSSILDRQFALGTEIWNLEAPKMTSLSTLANRAGFGSIDEALASKENFLTTTAMMGTEEKLILTGTENGTLEKLFLSKVTSKLTFGLLAGADVVLWAYTIVDILWGNLIWHDSAVGGASTGMSSLALDVPSAAEAAAWNSSHPQEQQIEANTKIAPWDVSGTETSNHNSLGQTQVFSFNDNNDSDMQVGIKINLSMITTPWIRLDPENKVDPYLGNIGPKDNNRGDAVIGMTIENMTDVSEIKDTQYEMGIADNEALGLSTLAEDNRYSAPDYSLNKITNLRTSKVLYSNGIDNSRVSGMKDNAHLAAISGLPLSAGNVVGITAEKNNIRFGSLSGLGLNKGQEVELNVSIPNDQAISRLKSKMGNGGGSLYALGYGIYYKGEDESGTSDYLPIRSNSFRSQLEAESTAPGYIYSHFDCSYPVNISDSCKLRLSLGGLDDNKKHMGHIYLADQSSKTQMIPVYINMHLVGSPFSGDAAAGSSDVHSISLHNYGAEDYKAIRFGLTDGSSLPEGLELLSSNPDGAPVCSNGLRSGGDCELSYKYNVPADMDSTQYNFVIYGVTGANRTLKSVPSADDQDATSYVLNVTGGY